MFQPFQTPQYATFGARLIAYIIDTLLLLVVTFPIGFIIGVVIGLGGGADSPELAAYARLISSIISLIATWLYYASLESSTWQATVGKRLFDIKVTDMAGNRIGFGRATGRHFSKFLSGVICLIGYFMAGFTERSQALHDMIAGTLVVTGKGTNPAITLDQTPPPPPSDFTYRG